MNLLYLGGMEPPDAGQAADVTGLLRAWSAGNRSALDQLAPILHAELKRIARRYMLHERQDHTLQPTALVNEAFLRLIDARGVEWHDRAHFFTLSAKIMRRILVDSAVARGAGKRGGEAQRVSFEGAGIVSPGRDSAVIKLDDALEELARVDPRKADVVELHFFSGLNFDEIAAVLKVSRRTIVRDWSVSKAWLAREMGAAPAHEPLESGTASTNHGHVQQTERTPFGG